MGSIRYILIFTILLQAPGCSSKPAIQPQVKKGILDLRNWNFQTGGPVELNGEWEFYWQKFRNELTNNDTPAYIHVPGEWNDFIHDGKKIGPEGFAAYKLKILLPENHEFLAIKYMGTDGGSRFYLNNEVYVQGDPGKTALTTNPIRYYDIVTLDNSSVAEITIDSANYFHRTGGIKTALVIGNQHALQHETDKERIIESMYAAAFFILGIYHLLFYLLYKNKMVLYFAIYSLLLSLRVIFVEERIVHVIFPNIDFRIDLSVEYLTFYLAVAAFALFIHTLFPQEFNKKIRDFYIFLGLLFSFSPFLPPVFYSQLIILFEIPVLVLIIIVIISTAIAIHRKRPTAVIFMFGFFFLLSSASIDIILHILYGYATSYSATGLLMFVISMGATLAINLNRMNREKEKSERESLENRHQMSLLQLKNDLINKDLDTAREMQSILEESNKTKDRFFSVIAHDLRGPMGSMRDVLNMLTTEAAGYEGMNSEEKEEFQELLTAVAGQSETTFQLLENLLTWALTQQDMVIYEIQVYRITDIIQPAVNLLLMQAAAKGVPVNFTAKDSKAEVYADLRTCHTIIRNILSNAIKFSFRGGKIDVNLREDDQYINIDITNHGNGISPEKIDQLLKLQQLKSTPGTEKESGSGLGLKLVFEYIRGNKGKLDIKSEPGQETTFTVSLPKA